MRYLLAFSMFVISLVICLAAIGYLQWRIIELEKRVHKCEDHVAGIEFQAQFDASPQELQHLNGEVQVIITRLDQMDPTNAGAWFGSIRSRAKSSAVAEEN